MSLPADATTGTLYIVPTPIGNLKDITLRAVDTLKSVDLIAAEDTRHSGVLMQHLGVSTPLLSVHEHNEASRASMLIGKLQEGQNIALVSDAGTPLISDPGYTLVNACREAGVLVSALPGPSALITALSGAGLPTDSFSFRGFLPVKEQAKKAAITALLDAFETQVFYEAPRRILNTLAVIQETLGDDRKIAIVKELTKTFEHYQLGSAASCIEWLNADPLRQKGEFVILISPADKQDNALPAEALQLLNVLQTELPLKKAAGIVAAHYGLKKNQLYQIGLESK
ncbi:16S rRNA (cytidine(1402)-2'-O)-methyltransferase [Alteromonas sp. 5E99-2]|uniref:16S rRNA (cytidine(1402)-2'-O)-methyltransferase n=1 Tax=Alteromonas sp. 5E99-2 TaxID=2817683 RepID=UPI001A995D4A|nr:16S rRNA (cytidine(1402)-2'-O)-methyltransferase [Alteromonas sp. 5E99-2]MBO1256362.1 16S rRNA (cytidine(1402)-2'-O)-methyltransferase [Alteromonas sp. 5E99-2]